MRISDKEFKEKARQNILKKWLNAKTVSETYPDDRIEESQITLKLLRKKCSLSTSKRITKALNTINMNRGWICRIQQKKLFKIKMAEDIIEQKKLNAFI